MTGHKPQNCRSYVPQFRFVRKGTRPPFRQPVPLESRTGNQTPTKNRLSRLRLCDSSAIRGPSNASIHGTEPNNSLREFEIVPALASRRNHRQANKTPVAISVGLL